MKFTDEHKKEMAMGEYFELGVHRVLIMLVEFGKTDNDKEYVEFTVTDGDTETKEGKARLWFTTDKAGQYAFNTIRGIFVHNAGDEAKKEAVRKKIDAVKDTAELEKVCQLLIGKEAWYEVAEDPKRTYQNDAGETKPSLNKNITGYEPTVKKTESAPQTVSAPAKGDDSEELMPKDF